MNLSKLAPRLYLLLTLTIATLFGLAQPTMAATDSSPAIAETSTQITQVVHLQNPLSQVRGDLANVWTNHGVSAPGVVMSPNTHHGLKDLAGCTCPACSGIIRDSLSQVG